jgi:hypothetical protein
MPLRQARALGAAAAADRKYGWGSVRARRAWLRYAHAVSPRTVEAVREHHERYPALGVGEWRRGR